MVSCVNSAKLGVSIILSFLLVMMLMQPMPMITGKEVSGNDGSNILDTKKIPSGLNAKISWPLINHPAIMLNGSTFEARVNGPSNITLTDWNFTLYREYRTHSLSYDTPLFNASTGEWHVNVTIPTTAEDDLYDLQIELTDGVNNLELVEWNAVQVRYEYPENFKIFHLTDTHQLQSWGPWSEITLSAIYQASMAGADMIIYTGDLTQDGTAASFTNFRNILRQSRVPTFLCPGNHDKDVVGYSTYSSFFGPDYYTANFGPDVFLVMANSHSPWHGTLNFTQIGWIERDMAASTAQFKIIGFHHPLYYVREEGYDPYNIRFLEAEAVELIRICDTYGVDLVLTGHLHNDRVDRVNDTLWILTTSCGGGPWVGAEDPGHHKDGFRVIEIENYTPVKWNWTTTEEWSQPWDKVVFSRQPTYFHDPDVGGHMTIRNDLEEPLVNQTVDYIVLPASAGVSYHTRDLVTGETNPVVKTVNGTDAWLIRFNVTLATGAATTVRIYSSEARAPSLASVEYPESVEPGVIYYLYANWTNPFSGIVHVGINISLNEEPFASYGMVKQSDGRYRYQLFLEEPASVRWRTVASDYSDRTDRSPMYFIENAVPTTTTPTIDPVLILGGAGVAVAIVVVVIVVFLYRRRSLSRHS